MSTNAKPKARNCNATTEPLVCSCHRGYVYKCSRKRHGSHSMHLAQSVHGSDAAHTYQWSVDARKGRSVEVSA